VAAGGRGGGSREGEEMGNRGERGGIGATEEGDVWGGGGEGEKGGGGGGMMGGGVGFGWGWGCEAGVV